jgi:hypothetical protein
MGMEEARGELEVGAAARWACLLRRMPLNGGRPPQRPSASRPAWGAARRPPTCWPRAAPHPARPAPPRPGAGAGLGAEGRRAEGG